MFCYSTPAVFISGIYETPIFLMICWYVHLIMVFDAVFWNRVNIIEVLML